MTPQTPEQIAGKLTKAQREDMADALYIAGDWVLCEGSDAADDLPETIADPVSGILTPLGLQVRAILRGDV